jgi:hypothetical protein
MVFSGIALLTLKNGINTEEIQIRKVYFIVHKNDSGCLNF